MLTIVIVRKLQRLEDLSLLPTYSSLEMTLVSAMPEVQERAPLFSM